MVQAAIYNYHIHPWMHACMEACMEMTHTYISMTKLLCKSEKLRPLFPI